MGKRKAAVDCDATSLAASIIDTILSYKSGTMIEVKTLRTMVLTASNLLSDDADLDKSSKKLFKTAVKLLEKDQKISLSASGIVELSGSERSKSESAYGDGETRGDKKRKTKKHKKVKRQSKDKEDDNELAFQEEGLNGEDVDKNKLENTGESYEDAEPNVAANDEVAQNCSNNMTTTYAPKEKNKPCKNNPRGITRLFLGNLPFAISEPTLNTHLQGCITHVKWITDKITGRFYGSAFVEVRSSKDAANAVSNRNGTKLMGRPIKINYAPVKPGEENDWPPRSRVITGGKMANASGGQAGGSGIKAMSVKPQGCCKLFIGNLSYDIDDERITKFFMSVESELKAVRWLHHRDSGDFKGCGYCEFWSTEACEKAATLNGKNLLGRPIRIDWAE